MDVKKSFTIEYTNFAKGIAIFLLLMHHFFYVKYTYPFASGNINELLVMFSKSCVPLFSLLSGFGVTKSYLKNKERSAKTDLSFTCLHVKKLLVNYWWVFVPALVIGSFVPYRGFPVEVYGSGINGLVFFVLDFLGISRLGYTPTFCNTWWFIEAALVFIVLLPLLYKAYKKLPVFVLTVLFLPLLYRQFFEPGKVLVTSDREIFYLFSFVLGMVFADRSTPDKLVRFAEEKRIQFLLISVLTLPLTLFLSAMLPLIGALLLALSVLMLVIVWKSLHLKTDRWMEFFGKYSMNVFLMHSLYLGFIRQSIHFESLARPVNILLQFAIVVVSNFALSYIIEFIKKKTKLLHAEMIKS